MIPELKTANKKCVDYSIAINSYHSIDLEQAEVEENCFPEMTIAKAKYD